MVPLPDFSKPIFGSKPVRIEGPNYGIKPLQPSLVVTPPYIGGRNNRLPFGGNPNGRGLLFDLFGNNKEGFAELDKLGLHNFMHPQYASLFFPKPFLQSLSERR